MRAILDTCVVIDVLQDRQPFSKDAKELFIYASNCLFDGYITANSATDIYYLTHRATHDAAKSKEILDKLFSLFEIADTTAMDCRRAVLSPLSDYEDAVLEQAAIRIGADCIVTRNLRDFSGSQVPVYTPAQLLDSIKNNC